MGQALHPIASGRPERRREASALPATTRCAQCRLDDWRKGQRFTRRIWWTMSAAGFALVLAVAFRANPKQGFALLVLAIVIVIAAYFYNRLLRRR